jgi:hypothetical protein
LIHHGRAINTFTSIEFGDTDRNLVACFLDPGLVFGIQAREQLQGDSLSETLRERQNFFSVGVTSSIQVILNEFFVFGSDCQHRYDYLRRTLLL